MKGTLHKTESGWQVWYHAKEDLFYSNTGVRILPLIDSDYYEVNRPGQYNDGKEVEFKVIHFPVPPTNGLLSNSIDTYAQLIDKTFVPMKGGESWDKILDKAIQDKAEAFTDGHYHYRGKDAFIEGYKQSQEDTKGIRYTEEDMRELYAYAKNDNTNLEDYLQALNKQDSEWITMKEGDITVNFKPMPEFDEPNIHNEYPTKLHQLQIQAAEECFRKYPNNEDLYTTDELKNAYKAGVIDGLKEWTLDSYDRPKYPEVKIICPRCKDIMPCECNANWDTIWKDFRANKNSSYSWSLIEYLKENYNPPIKKQDNG